MKAYVINLPKDLTRREFQEIQLNRLGLNYEVVDAVSTNDIEPSIYKMHENDWQRPLRNVEVACYYSHQSLWKKIIETNEPALILEDDALLSKHVPFILNDLSKLTNMDYVTLEVRGRKKLVSNKAVWLHDSGTKLYRLYLDRTGAAGYVLYPSGAKKLLELEKQVGIGLADAHITSCYNLIGYQVEPAPIIQLDKCEFYNLQSPFEVKSNISTKEKSQLDFSNMLYFKTKRISAQLKQAMQQIKYMFKARRRYIEINNLDYIDVSK